MPVSRADIQACKAVQRQHGKSYFLATRLMPKRLREATFVLYAFFRLPDELVDNPKPGTPPDQALEDWQQAWRVAYHTGNSDQPVLRAAAAIHAEHHIPIAPSETFLAAMRQDLIQDRYQTYADLKQYMDGSAAAVGEIMTYTIGFSDSQAIPLAHDLGYAMQLTNFLRDIAEDYDTRNRIYLPQDLLTKHGVTEDDLKHHRFTPGVKTLVQELGNQARALYRSADQGIPLLNADGQGPVRVASQLYEAILDKLKAQDWNPFAGRASTSAWEKLRLLSKAL